jgi:hypothetical protein
MEDINAEHESYFRLLTDTGLIYLAQRSRDLVWKTTLDISINIQVTSHRNGGSSCHILFQTTWILYADSIYQSKFYLEDSVDTFVDPSRPFALRPEHLSYPRSAIGTMGLGDGDCGTPWTRSTTIRCFWVPNDH